MSVAPHDDMRTSLSLTCMAIAGLLIAGCEQDVTKEAPVTAKNAPEVVASPAAIGAPGEGVVAEFQRRVKDYLAIREQVAGSMDNLPNKASPREIDARQRALGALMAKARSDAKVGDIFVPEMRTFVRGLIRRVLAGPDGPRIKGSLMDENPMGVSISVNGRYPDTVPMSTMPPDVLAALPKLPEEMEYRFVGNRLILLDVASHLIVDYVDNTFEV